jgi:hypothetical protein
MLLEEVKQVIASEAKQSPLSEVGVASAVRASQ